MQQRIECADTESFLATVPDGSVGLILTDPPYFRVKDLRWDKAWPDIDRFIAWLSVIADEWKRVLKPNGTLVCFAGCNPSVARGASAAARVECMLGERFDVVASPVWGKAEGWHLKCSQQELRTYVPQTERVIICEQYGADSSAKCEAGYDQKCDELRGFVFEPLRKYLADGWARAELTFEDARAAVGCADGSGLPSHWFTQSQWALPTAEKYAQLQAYANRNGGDFLRREYEDLRREYEDLRREYEDLRREYEDLRRPFNARAGQYFTDVWHYKTLPGAPGKHPCEKPPDMALDIVRQCSREGDLVLDTFCGSGVFLSAAAQLGRVPIGCDADPKWAEQTVLRIKQDTAQLSLF